MDLAVIILAAAEHAAEEHHKSETPFFIAGTLLATFAIVISIFGFKRPDFPATASAAHGVMAASMVFVAGALFTAIYVAL